MCQDARRGRPRSSGGNGAVRGGVKTTMNGRSRHRRVPQEIMIGKMRMRRKRDSQCRFYQRSPRTGCCGRMDVGDFVEAGKDSLIRPSSFSYLFFDGGRSRSGSTVYLPMSIQLHTDDIARSATYHRQRCIRDVAGIRPLAVHVRLHTHVSASTSSRAAGRRCQSSIAMICRAFARVLRRK